MIAGRLPHNNPHAEVLAEGEPRSIGRKPGPPSPFEAPPAAVRLRVRNKDWALP